jgi:mRNA interferase RelE/StbE
MTFTMNLSHQAKKEMAKLDRPLIRRLRDRLRELAENPLNPRLSRQMETDPNRRYSRVGDWRIVFQVIEQQKVIEVSTIQHRSRVYKELKK